MRNTLRSSRRIAFAAIAAALLLSSYTAISLTDSTVAASGGIQPMAALVVNTTADTTDGLCTAGLNGCTLREAIDASNALPGIDSITFDINSGIDPGCSGVDCVIDLTGALPDLSGMTITGPQAVRLTVRRSGGPRFRIFTVADAMTVSIANLTITGGYTPNGIDGTNEKGGNRNGGPGVPGGGIYNPENSILNLAGVTMTNNRPGEGGNPADKGFAGRGGHGGAVYNLGTLTVDRSTISGNLSGGVVPTEGASYGWGGGIFDSGTSTVSNSTISNNTCGEEGKFPVGNGAGLYSGGATTLRNTIVSGNYYYGLETTITNNIAGTVNSMSAFNIVGTGGDGALSDGVNANQVGVDNLQLGPLQDNGGPTSTHAVLAGSPAIDKGDDGSATPTIDQRGTTRPLDSVFIANAPGGDGSDVGAFERAPVVAGSTLVVNSTGDASDVMLNGICDDGTGKCTLRAAVEEVNRDALTADTINFDIPPTDPGCSGGACTIDLTGGIADLTFVTINGPTATRLTVRRNGGPRFRIFTIAPVSTVSISNMTITGGFTPNGPNGSGDEHPNGFPGIPGGGIYNPANSSLSLSGVTLTNNQPGRGGNGSSGGFPGRGGNGGAIYNLGALSIDRSTISGNRSGAAEAEDATFGHGGGIFDFGVTTISNSTITNNTCGEVGSFGTGTGGGLILGASTTLRNTIVSGNSIIGGGPNNIAGGVLAASSFNLVGTGGDGGMVNGVNANQVGVDDAFLGPLQNNGGPTLTHALIAGSSAIDKGENGSPGLTFDQLLQPRPFDNPAIPNASGGDGSDIGSFEIQLASVSGVVSYAIVDKPVPGVLMTGAGSVMVNSTTTSDGLYLLTQFGSGSYVVTPTRAMQSCAAANGIFANDAALVSRHVVGLQTLTGDAFNAGRVAGAPTISSADASLIARSIVGICTDAGSLAGQWRFSPANRSYSNLTITNGGQNYSAYMIGDVNGDWNPAGANRPSSSVDVSGDAVAASVPAMRAPYGSELIVPLTLDGLAGSPVDSYQFDILFDPSVISPALIAASVEGTNSYGLTVISNSPAKGRLKVAVYGAVPVYGDGVYVHLKFIVIGATGSNSALTIDGFRLGDNTLEVSSISGNVRVNRKQDNR